MLNQAHLLCSELKNMNDMLLWYLQTYCNVFITQKQAAKWDFRLWDVHCFLKVSKFSFLSKIDAWHRVEDTVKRQAPGMLELFWQLWFAAISFQVWQQLLLAKGVVEFVHLQYLVRIFHRFVLISDSQTKLEEYCLSSGPNQWMTGPWTGQIW